MNDPDFVMDSWSSPSSGGGLYSVDGQTSGQVQHLDPGEAMDVEEYNNIGAEERTQLLAEALAHIESLEQAEDDDDKHVDEPTDPRHIAMHEGDGIVADALYTLLQNVGTTLEKSTLFWASFQPRLTEQLLPTLPTLRELSLSRDFSESRHIEPKTDDPVGCLFPSL